jgi:hypothetical protein
MKRNSLWIGLRGFILLIVISSFIYPTSNTVAQKKECEMDKVTLDTLSESVFAQRLYDNVKSSNVEWKLERAYFEGFSSERNSISFLFENKMEVRIFVTNYESEAKKRLDIKLSRGIVKNYNEKGDEGLKTFTATDGTFASLLFKKGKFFVSIYCKDEKVAEYFADQVLKSIEGH